MPKSNDPPRRLHPLKPRSARDGSWQRRQWRRYLDNTIDTITQHLTPPVHTSRTQTPAGNRSTSSSSPSLPNVGVTSSPPASPPASPVHPTTSTPSPYPGFPTSVAPSAPPVSPVSPGSPVSPHPPVQSVDVRAETSAETIARLTPQESLFDRNIADRRRQRRARTSPNPARPTAQPKPAATRTRRSNTSVPTPQTPPAKTPRAQTSRAQTPRPQIPLPFNVTPLRRSGSVPPVQPTRSSPQSRRRAPLHPLVYGVRLVVLGVGLSAIAGTVLSVLSPASQAPAPVVSERQADPQDLDVLPVSFQRTQEIAALSTQLESLAARYPEFQLGVSLVDVDTGAFVDLNGDRTLAAASTIKLPLLVAFFQAVDRGEIRLDDILTLQAEQVAGGSGTMQFDEVGTQYSALEVVTQMIVISDNTATNIIINRLGGASLLNAQFQSWGMARTVLNAPLPDLRGTNTASPDDLTHLLASIDRGELVSLRSRDRLLDILEATENDSLLPQALGTGATIAHKTGNIKHSLGDSGLIDLPNGKRYVVSAIVKRPAEDDRAAEIVRQVSQLAHDYFSGAGNIVAPMGNPDLPATQQARRPLDRPAP